MCPKLKKTAARPSRELHHRDSYDLTSTFLLFSAVALNANTNLRLLFTSTATT
ncbi:hypothetical protein YC2023_011172 [Brassica napus]